jgi:maltose O-acetyltransferase
MNLRKWLLIIPHAIYYKLMNWSNAYRYENYRSKYDLDPTFRFNGWEIQFYGEGHINIGRDTYIGRYSSVQSEKGYFVKIGEGCAISHNVRIYTKTYVPDQDFSMERAKKSANVVIGNYVWIGANVLINPGVTIGENSIIGANSVVTRDVEPWSIVGGVPAKLIRMKQVEGSHLTNQDTTGEALTYTELA